MIPPIVYAASLLSQGLLEVNESHNRGGYRGLLATDRFQNRSYMRLAGLQKSNPIPVGRYWIDVFEDGIPTWIGWSGGNLATVSIEKTEFYKGTSKIMEIAGWIYPWVPGDKQVIPDRAWIIFNVTAPTTWGIEDKLGWPNTAPKNIQTSDDTVTKPIAEDTLPWWQGGNQGLPGVKIALGALGIAAGVIAGAYVIRSFK